jgi:galactose mutarotase-like enzyme
VIRRPRNSGLRGETDATLRGWRIATIENRSLRVTVATGKGADVIEFLHKPTDIDLTYRTLRDLRTYEQVRSTFPTPDGFFTDAYAGGWQEVLPNGGASSSLAGADLAQHGETSATPFTADLRRPRNGRLELVCTARTTAVPLDVTRTFALDEDATRMELRTDVRNPTGVRLPLSWGLHLAFGAPFVGPGSRIELPPGTAVVPHAKAVYPSGRRLAPEAGRWPTARADTGEEIDLSVLPPAGTRSDLAYLRPPVGRYTIASDVLRVQVEWDLGLQPYLWYWQEFGAVDTAPWWGAEYVIGLEPFSSAPGGGIAEVLDGGTARWIEPGQTLSAAYSIGVEEVSP